MRVCACVCVRACVRACVCTYVCVRVYAVVHVIAHKIILLGAMAWIQKLKWGGLPDFLAASRTPVYADTTHQTAGYTDGFHQAFHNMEFYWILNAGHMVGSDQRRHALLTWYNPAVK